MDYSYRCSTCGKVHEGLPFSYAAAAPLGWELLPIRERRKRAKLGMERCTIRHDGDRSVYVRGNIQIPVLDADQPFSWTVWVSLSEANFARTVELWDQPGRETEPPYPGRLDTELPYAISTVDLPVMVRTQPVGERPLVEVEPTGHALAVEQREGITLARVREIAERVLHG